MAARSALAPAKVNLFLHVGPAGPDGYHPLASLVAFADVGDQVTVGAASAPVLSVVGPFAGEVPAGRDNLVLRALRALAGAVGGEDLPLAVQLDKRLPVAAGLGGGSSDAGAALKLAREVLALPLDDAALAEAAAVVGADGPMCLYARAAWATGRGDRLRFEPRLPPLPAVLANPLVPSATGAVYRAYDEGPAAAADLPPPPATWEPSAVIAWLTGLRNDLQAPAAALQPAIGEVLDAASGLAGVRLVRMSGSGATVFALFDTAEEARDAAADLAGRRPDWWVRSTLLS